jgi:hypothetical protein
MGRMKREEAVTKENERMKAISARTVHETYTTS